VEEGERQLMALHPRFREYGLSDDDADLVNSFRHAARRAGWSSGRVEEAFAWFKERGHGQMSPEARMQSFREFVGARGWGDAETDQALGWFNDTASRIESGRALDLPPAPTAQEDATRRAELEGLMRTDPDAYWRDAGLQDELYEINARAEGGSSSSTPAATSTPQQASRRSEIETMMREDLNGYFRDAGVQAEYRALLGGGEPPDPTSGEAAAPGGAAGEGL
jgi:hypothetical protein